MSEQPRYWFEEKGPETVEVFHSGGEEIRRVIRMEIDGIVSRRLDYPEATTYRPIFQILPDGAGPSEHYRYQPGGRIDEEAWIRDGLIVEGDEVEEQ